jgi:Zinc finger, C3HC4 type (RING finger)
MELDGITEKNFYTLDELLACKSETNWIGMYKNHYTFSIKGFTVKNSVFDISEDMRANPFKLLASLCLHTDKESQYEIVYDFFRRRGFVPEHSTRSALVYMSIRMLLLLDPNYDGADLHLDVYNKRLWPFIIHRIGAFLGAKWTGKNGKTSYVRPFIFGKEIYTSPLSVKVALMLDESEAILPHVDGLNKKYRKVIQAKEDLKRNDQLVNTFLKRFALFTQSDVDYVNRLVDCKINLQSVFESFQYIKHCPSYRLGMFKEAINGIIINGTCSTCWARKNGANIFQCQDCKCQDCKRAPQQTLGNVLAKKSASKVQVLNIDFPPLGESNNLCSICEKTKINITLSPCGHCFCNICIDVWESPTCPTCRSNYEKTQKIFI